MSFLYKATSAINERLTPTASEKKKLNTQESVLWFEKLTHLQENSILEVD